MEAVPQLRKFVLAGTIAALATLGTTATAYADDCPNAPSSVQQYVECVPSASGGSQPTGSSKKTRPIPKPIEQKIDEQGGDDAGALKEIVSSEASGAPVQTQIKVNKAKPKAKPAQTNSNNSGTSTPEIVSDAATRKSNPLAASVGVITDGSDGRLIALIVLMVGVAALVVFSALRRRRVTR